MKKGIKFTFGLSIQILILGIIGFFGTFIYDFLEGDNLFGDYWAHSNFFNRTKFYWGARHHWYVWTLLLLILIQVTRIIMYCASFWNTKAKATLS